MTSPPSTALPVAALLLALACGGSESPAAVDAAPPVSGAQVVFDLVGVPGPWWRPGATADAFETEHRACLARSREARARSGARDPADAAYRAFLDCMTGGGWIRGLPPAAPPAG